MFKLKPVRSLVGIGILGAFGLIASGGAQATAGYCVASPLTTDPLTLTDVSFTIGSTTYGPIDCYGIVDTGSSNVATNLTYVNNLTWPDFVGGVKDDIGGGSNSVVVDNIQYTLTTGSISNPGTLNSTQAWTLSWTDTNGSTDPNLPVTVDFAIQWDGGNKDVFYLFDNVLLTAPPDNSGSGIIDIKVTNPPGNSDLQTSHLTAFFSNATPSSSSGNPSSGPIPEPGTLSLVGAAILGGLFSYRRRRQSLA